MAKNKGKDKDKDSADDSDGDDGAKKKKLMIVGGVVAAAAGYFGGEPAEAMAPTTTIPLEEEADGAILAVGALTVNLVDDQPRFGRIAFSVLLVEGTDPLLIEPRLPLLLDAALSELALFEASELRTLAGQERLRDQLTERAIEILNSEDERVVKRVLLTDLLVQ
ncbi:MAG: flagellar basal body-associated FliL family protein [Actinobacteria bacterium]|nr:flagellar basal body-associated FliL family protein [Actinomycetota bacterium]